MLHNERIHINPSSTFEVRRFLQAAIPAGNINFRSQASPVDFIKLTGMNVQVNACSFNQLTATKGEYSRKMSYLVGNV